MKDRIKKQSFIFATIVIYGLFAVIAYAAYEKVGLSWQLLVVFPFAPTILSISNYNDIKNGRI